MEVRGGEPVEVKRKQKAKWKPPLLSGEELQAEKTGCQVTKKAGIDYNVCWQRRHGPVKCDWLAFKLSAGGLLPRNSIKCTVCTLLLQKIPEESHQDPPEDVKSEWMNQKAPERRV